MLRYLCILILFISLSSLTLLTLLIIFISLSSLIELILLILFISHRLLLRLLRIYLAYFVFTSYLLKDTPDMDDPNSPPSHT